MNYNYIYTTEVQSIHNMSLLELKGKYILKIGSLGAVTEWWWVIRITKKKKMKCLSLWPGLYMYIYIYTETILHETPFKLTNVLLWQNIKIDV